MARDGARRRRGGLGWLSSLVWSIVLGALLFVTTQELRSGPTPVAPAGPHLDCSTRLADLPTQIEQATALLQQSGLPLPTPVEETQGAERLRYVHRRYDLTLPSAATVDELKQRLRPLTEHDPCVSVDATGDATGAQVRIGIDDVLTHTLNVRWVVPTPLPVRVAIIVDDLGDDLLVAHELTTLNVPITLGIMPFRPFSRQVAELAHLFHLEVILHLPMETNSGQDFGDSHLLKANATEDDVYPFLDDALASVPYAVGANNPVGSRFTGDSTRMGWVLGWLKLHQLFLVDSVTTADSAVNNVAAGLGIKVARRSLFLDASVEESAVRAQLDALLQAAREHGFAIGIAHPHAVTVEALRTTLPQWRAAGINVVPVSALVQVPTLAAQ
jgi:uncharacterized protein